MGDTLFRSDRDNRLGIGIEIDPVATLVPVADREPQLEDTARNRIAMVRALGRGVDQFGDNMRRRRLVGITHPEVDNVLAGATGFEAQLADRVENVRW